MDEIECLRVAGPLETQKRTVSDFNSIYFSDVGNLHISQGNEYSITLKGQEVILEKVKTSVTNNKLVIRVENCFNGDEYSLDIYITAPDIEKIEMSGAGNVITETPITTDVFTLIVSGVSEMNPIEVLADSISTIFLGDGMIHYSGNARAHKIVVSGTGEIDAYSLITNSTDITSNGDGDIFVTTSEQLNAVLKNTGSVYYKGNPIVTMEEINTGKLIDAN
jgi:hypothetical protein